MKFKLFVYAIFCFFVISFTISIYADLKAYWTLNESSGSVSGDSAGVNNLTIHNALHQPGWSGDCLYFDGTQASYAENSSPSPSYGSLPYGNNEYTVCVWLYRDEINKAEQDSVFMWGNWYYTRGMNFIVIDNGNIEIQHDNYDWNTGIALSTQTWTFIAFTHDISYVEECYINGVKQGEKDGTMPLNILGGFGVIDLDYCGWLYGVKGKIDEVRVYDTKLAGSDILALYNLPPIDTTPPTAPSFVNISSAPLSPFTLSATWGYSTAKSSITAYSIALGSTVAGTEVINWANVGNVVSTICTHLNLSIGTTYYFSVAAVSGVGLWSSTTTSSGKCMSFPSSIEGIPSNYPGIVVLYKFDEGTSTNTKDEIDGSIGNLTGTKWHKPSHNGSYCMEIDTYPEVYWSGFSQGSSVTPTYTVPTPIGSNPWSVSAWIYDLETSTTDAITGNGNSQAKSILSWGIQSGSGINPHWVWIGASYHGWDNMSDGITLDIDGANYPASDNSYSHYLPQNMWHHIILTCDGTYCSWYVDNSSYSIIGSWSWNYHYPFDMPPTDGRPFKNHIDYAWDDFYVGGWCWNDYITYSTWHGYIDEVAVFDHVLTSAERTVIYNYDLPFIVPISPRRKHQLIMGD